MFELTAVEKRHGDTLAVAVASWRAGSGEAWLLGGPSGSGKSTLLHLIAGLTAPTSGRIVVAGQDLAALAPGQRDRWRGRTVGLVPQRLHLVGAVSVADNLRLAQRLAGVERDDARIDRTKGDEAGAERLTRGDTLAELVARRRRHAREIGQRPFAASRRW